jgi:hypothetical protein
VIPIWLTPDELVELTGYKQPAAQIRWLRTNGIDHTVNAAGKPKVKRTYGEVGAGSPMRGVRPPATPDFEALRRRH